MSKTPQEAAKELVEKFRYPARIDGTGSSLPAAKTCALICTNEIIGTLYTLHKPEYVTFLFEPPFDGYELKDYWLAVKTSIETL